MKKILLVLLLLLPAMASAQILKLESVNIVRVGYWQVVSPDTITNHPSQYQANERQLNLLLQGVPQSQIVIKPPLYEVRGNFSEISPDTVYAEAPADTFYTEPDTVEVEVPGDTVYAYQEKTLYATEIPDTTAMYYDVHESLRNIDWQIIEEHPDSTAFRVRVFGTTTADRVSFASKCIGHDADMNLLTQTESISLTPDSTGYVEGETSEYMCHPPGGNAAMNYWLTARFDDSENILVIGYIDIAHIRGLGN